MSQPESRYPFPLSRKPPKGHNIVVMFVSYKVDLLYKKLVRYEYISHHNCATQEHTKFGTFGSLRDVLIVINFTDKI